MSKSICGRIIFLLLFPALLLAEEPVDLQAIQRIKEEGLKNSKIMETTSYLTDVYGPRLMGSPDLREAAEWSMEQLKAWGISDVKIENWGTFGRGWENDKIEAAMTEPRYMPLIAYPKAWTQSTNGTLKGTPYILEVESEEELDAISDSLTGAIVMLGKPREWEMNFKPEATRYSDEELAEIAMAEEPGAKSPWADRREEYRKYRALRKRIDKFLENKHVGVILEASQRENGTVRVYDGGSYKLDESLALPDIVVANEHYGRIYRILKKNKPVTLEITVQNRTFEQDTLGYNVIAEIPGTDRKLKDEVVMIGAHLDSWHAGTGATDNASNCAIVMEVMRILKTIGITPRRTIRMALWSGEEEGYLGSRGYLENHYGDRRTMVLKDAHKDFDVYFNLDNGSGKIRGIYCQENDAVRPIFEDWLAPFNDMGATVVTMQNTSGTDHIPFNEIGLPGFQFVQDPLDYMNRTHHTNMDVYEHVPPGDVMQAAVIMASFAYHAAMRDTKIPRKALPKPKPKDPWDD
jgi:carboxypeptidase Q